MALGTITRPGVYSDYVQGNKRVCVRDVQLTAGANYTTGGETITASAVGLNRITEAVPLGLAVPAGGATSRSVGFIFAANQKSVKMVVQTTASAEAASNSDQSTFTARIEFVGA